LNLSACGGRASALQHLVGNREAAGIAGPGGASGKVAVGKIVGKLGLRYQRQPEKEKQ
jgi:hypothetical protein